MTKRILVLAEGKNDKQVFNNLFRSFNKDEFEVVTFKTDIYQLSRLYESQGRPYEEIDLQSLLLGEKTDLRDQERKVLKLDYVDRLLIFDFDPHAPQAQKNGLLKLMHHFSDSSDAGKLYINYPMLESYRHISKKCIEELRIDTDFSSRTFSSDELSESGSYKTRSGREGFTSKRISAQQWNLIIDHHLQKVKNILEINNNFDFSQEKFIKLLQIQQNQFDQHHYAQIVNTSLLIFPELYPNYAKSI